MLDAKNRDDLLNDIEKYQASWILKPLLDCEESKGITENFIKFISENPNCFERENLKGHITASGFIVDFDFQKVLLTHHKKLNDWLQLGGHADGDPIAHNVALKECQEESGLKEFEFVNFWTLFGQKSPRPLIFDLDCHLIPARKSESEHFHYDVRYLLKTDSKTPLQISEESQDLKWVSIKEAYSIARQISMHRPFKKIEYLRNKIASI